MESIKREKRVQKLVHPGRHIEVHKEPIRAAEVIRKNPRNCITRPDVFKFPWIVVKPESVLLPGSDVAPCGACRPWIFFINGVLCFLKFDDSGMEKEKDDWRCHFKEKMSLEKAYQHRKPWIRA